MSRSSQLVLDLPEEDWILLERTVERFETAWHRGLRPAIEDHLAQAPSVRRAALIELVHVELEFRLGGGEPARVEEYLRRFPELAADPAATWDLIATEIELRRFREPALTLSDYLGRFPAYRDQLLAIWPEGGGTEEGPRGDPGSGAVEAGVATMRPDPYVPASGTADERTCLGKFVLRDEIGRGAFGIVYRAYDIELDRVVALKVPRPGDLATGEEAERFLREARSAARLQHPGIVAIYDAGRIGETCYLAEELIPGPTLADRLATDRLDFRTAAELAARVAEALDCAHRQGVVHRDLKPSNILLDGDGRPHVGDFGLAKRDGGGSTLTTAGQVLGTPAYMSPEQARGEAHQVDGRSDVYSLGVILYQLLTGELPFRGHVRMVLHQVLHDEPRAPRGLDDRVPRDLETICLKAMAKEPARRYASAGELAEDLHRFLRGEPIRARPVRAWERARSWARRRPTIAALTGLVVLVTALGFGGVLWQWRRAEAARGRLEMSLYFHLIALAERELEANDLGRAAELLAQCPPGLRGWEWHYLRRLCHGSPPEFRGHTGLVFDVAFSPDGRRLATAGGDHTVRIWDAGDGREIRRLRGHNDLGRDVAFSPDGRRLASVGGDQVVRIWDATSGEGLHALGGHTDRVTGVAFGPDGRRLASSSGDGSVRIWDPIDGRAIRTLRANPFAALNSVAFSPNGRRVASDGADGLVRLWDLATDRESLTLQGHSGVVLSVAFCPDGDRLASAGADGSLRLWYVPTGQEILSLRGHGHVVWSVAFSPDGHRLASAGGGGAVKVWDATTLQEEPAPAALTLRGDAHIARSVAFSPDTTTLASAGGGGTVRIWDVASGREVARLLGHRGAVDEVAYSPDGRRLASGGVDGTVRLWDVSTRRGVLTLRADPLSAVSDVAFSPDGKHLAAAGTDGIVRLWDLGTGQEALAFRGHSGAVTGVAFSPDGRHLASAGWDQAVRIWDATTGREVRALRGHSDYLECVAYSPDGQHLASAGRDGTIKIWDAATGRELRSLPGHRGLVIWDVAFSPDGRRLASARGDGALKVWDPTTGREILHLHGHTSAVYAVAFSADGRRMASGSRDQAIKIWDVSRSD